MSVVLSELSGKKWVATAEVLLGISGKMSSNCTWSCQKFSRKLRAALILSGISWKLSSICTWSCQGFSTKMRAALILSGIPGKLSQVQLALSGISGKSNCTSHVKNSRKSLLYKSWGSGISDNWQLHWLCKKFKHLLFPFRISGILHVSLLLEDFRNIEKQLRWSFQDFKKVSGNFSFLGEFQTVELKLQLSWKFTKIDRPLLRSCQEIQRN